MLNGIWVGMVLVSLLYGAFSGRLDAVMEQAIASASEAVQVSLGLLGALALWCGVMKILEQAGGVAVIGRIFRPILKGLFPKLKEDSPAMGAIVLNLSANLLGISNAATPLGIRAMEELQKANQNPREATNEMCLFVVLNTASVQLVPTTLIALRQAAGVENPFAITLPILVVSLLALVAGILAVKLGEKRW